ncbi:hypothetical protein NDU88_008012 [Pleurodeles waltl]|uniref:Gypsy retrotransposon integrase-like protein 1 n=1 Tax=Pleurodeles waltl TaxID=8319 RepID=A0AAV7RR39_PLEWA|nr:hypothetical protein NDU88_008012 [Pleurodeles waltl]
MSSTDVTVVELDTTPYLHLKMRELRSLCKIKKITMGPKPTKIQLQELLAEFEKANPSEGGNSEEEDSDQEENSPLPVLSRENRVPQTLTPKIIVRDAGSLTGETNTSEITEDSPSEEDIQLARMAKRLALERQILAIERERQEMGLGPINGGSNINRVRDSPDMLKIPKGIVTKYEDGDDITKWFTAFERACVTRKVNRSHWGALLWEMFTGKCRDRLLTLSGQDAESYDLMKGTLIEGFGFSTEEYRIRFRGAQKSSSQTWVDFVDYSVKTLDGWIQGSGVSNYDGLYNLFVKEHLLSNCFNDKLHQHLVDLGPISPQELGKKADHWVKTRVSKTSTGGDQKKGVTKTPQGKGDETTKTKNSKESSTGPQKPAQEGGPRASSQNNGYKGKNFDPKKAWCHSCKQHGHQTGDKACPKKGSTPNSHPSNTGMASLQVGSTVCPEQIRVHTEATLVSEGGVDLATLAVWPPNMQKYRQQLLINGTRIEGLRDTGASVTMVTEKLVSPGQYLTGKTYTVTNADNQRKVHPMAMVTLEWGGVNGLKQVVVSSNIPVDCLLGNDLESSAWAEVELKTHAAMLGIPELVCVKTRAQCKAQGEQVELESGRMAQPTKRTGKSVGKPTATQQKKGNLSSQEEVLPSEGTEPLELEPYQVELLGPGGPSREELCKGQETCPSLEGLRQQAAEESKGKKNGTHRVYWEDGLLYTEARDPKPGATRRVVVPQLFREFILTLAHDIPLAGHLGQTKTWERLVNHFYWPNMSNMVKEFCLSCPTCQASGKTGGHPKAPLIPLPVVGVPFERVGVDIVGPLEPPTASGNMYILVVVDHATRYPEAIPLRSTTAPAVAKALIGIFTRVGFPKEVVSDRGTNFMSAYLKHMWNECGVTYKFTTPYHLQTNGLVERFNKTLKGMIMGLPEKLKRRWDVLLPCLLFAYREVPQKGVGFSPFELLFGHPVRGPLALVKEGWERPLHEPKQDIVDYVLGLRSRMAEYMEKATKNLEASQQLQKFWYDQKAALVEFQPGQKVWVLEPVAPRALQDKWSGPYPVLERKSQVTYLVDLGTSRSPKRVIHGNRLKLFHDRADVNLLMVTEEDQEAESEPLPDLLSSDPKDGTVDGVIYSDTLSGQQQADCRRVLQQFPELFSLTPGQTHLCTHDVDTGDSMPVKNKIFRQSDHVKESIKVEVHKMLELGVIERSDSPWASPVVLVPKPHTKDGKKEMRFCVDYRGLNSVTKTDAHPIPRADELIDKLGAAKFLSTFDLTAGYWQIKMAPGAKEKTAFSTPDGHYQFTVMPFGLKNAPATFQRLVNQVLAGLESFSTAYLDDIAVFSSTWQDHLVHLKKVLKALQSAGLSIKASKCQIGQGTVVYLGHLVGGGQVQPLQPKIQTILDWVAPKTQTQVRAFLGLTGYYRRFVKGYGSIVTALTELTSKKMPKKVNWTVECQQAFDTLKQAMCSAPVLKAPDYSKQFIVQTDASEHGIGAVLSQTNDDGLDQPVAFISRRLLPREQRWSAIEREAFAVVWSLKKLRPYLFGTHFLVQTDHRPLKWLMQMKGENPKLLRWSISLQGMDFIVEHRPGTAHANADGLSRFFHLENEDSLGKG